MSLFPSDANGLIKAMKENLKRLKESEALIISHVLMMLVLGKAIKLNKFIDFILYFS